MKKIILHVNNKKVSDIEKKAADIGTEEARVFAVNCRNAYEERETVAKENVSEATGEDIDKVAEITVVIRVEADDAIADLMA